MAQNPIITKKGTSLPVLDLRGKPYLQVAHRLVWFREEHPDWQIRTVPIVLEKDRSMFRAEICDHEGKIIAVAHKQEDAKGFQDHSEKAETGAIGRALALCGYGTQFAPELDETEVNPGTPARIVDSPIQRVSVQTAPKEAPLPGDFNFDPTAEMLSEKSGIGSPEDEQAANYVCKYGKKYYGQSLRTMGPDKVRSLRDWLIKENKEGDNVKDFIRYADLYLKG